MKCSITLAITAKTSKLCDSKNCYKLSFWNRKEKECMWEEKKKKKNDETKANLDKYRSKFAKSMQQFSKSSEDCWNFCQMGNLK